MTTLIAALMLTPTTRPPKPVAVPFPLSAVRLLPGPLESAHQAAAKYLLKLDPQRLLAGFRANSGLPPGAEIYGGWETMGLAGHSLGHYLTACAQEFARTQDPAFKDRVDECVAGLVECQKARPDGFLAAFRFEEGFDRARLDKIWADVAAGNIKTGGFDLNGMWSPWYVHHKVFAGLLDADALCGNKKAIQVASKFANWAQAITKNLTPEQWQKMVACEYGGMNESLAELAVRTKNPSHLQLARKFYDRPALDPLTRGTDELAGKHSNTQIPKLIGLARLYELTGDPQDAFMAAYFWERIVDHHSYAIGGNSNGEHLGPPDQLRDRLSSNTAETCNTYNMLKLTRHLFSWGPEAREMDYYERAYFNHILASQDPETAGVTYFLPLATGRNRTYSSPYNDFTCCHGTGMENHTKHGDSAYFHSGGKTLWVNLFLPSELTWREAQTTLRQETSFPESGKVKISVLDGGGTFEVKLRHPAWAKGPVEFRVNGEKVAVSVKPSSYASIKRAWKKGDQLEFEMPMKLWEERMPDDPKRVALMYGPIVLAADLGPSTGPEPRTPVLVTNGRPVEEWIKPVPNQPLTFSVDDAARPVALRFLPLYRLHHNRYGVYFDKFSQEEWERNEAEYRAEESRQQDLASRTVDQVTIGEMQPERDHNLKSERNDVRDANGRSFRTVLPGGWFEVGLKVDQTKPATLVVTYWGNDRLWPDFKILVDGIELASEDLAGRPANRFFDVEYPLPSSALKGKAAVTVRVQPREGKSGPSVAAIRSVRGKA